MSLSLITTENILTSLRFEKEEDERKRRKRPRCRGRNIQRLTPEKDLLPCQIWQDMVCMKTCIIDLLPRPGPVDTPPAFGASNLTNLSRAYSPPRQRES